MIGVFLAAAVLVVTVFYRYYMRHWTDALTLTLSFSQSAAYAGNQIEFTETVENRKRMPLHVLEASFRVPRGIEFADAENICVSDYIYKRDLFALLGMEEIRRRYALHCIKRGRYSISQVNLRTWSLFFLSTLRKELTVTDELYVYAARTDISRILRPLEAYLGETQSRRKYMEDPFAFVQIREYTPGDPMRNVNWKASARTGELMVNTFSSVLNEQVSVYLDVEDLNVVPQEKLVEEGISTAATLVSALHERALDTGLAVNACPDGQTSAAYFKPGHGTGFITAVERFLTEDFDRMSKIPFPEMIENIPEDGRIAVLISKDISQKMRDAVAAFAAGDRRVIWVIPVSSAEEKAALPYTDSANLSIVAKIC